MAKKENQYSATIRECSKELSAKEKVMYKDTSNATQLVDYVRDCRANDGRATIDYDSYAIIEVHNEAADNKDYTIFLFVDKAGNKYYTSSEPCFNSFLEIYKEMKDETEPWGLEFNLSPSKKHAGKEILTCSLI